MAALNCNSSRRTVPSGKFVVMFAHWHICACGEICICANDPCWRELTTNAGLPVPWSWKCPACRLEEKRAGISGMHPHVLRHSCATHCLNHGMDIRFVQELLGHKNLQATQKYLHVATANLQRVHKKFLPRG
jgi:Phage integrase family